jgi:hypothetical protein
LDKAKANAGQLVLSSSEDDMDADSLVDEEDEQDSNAGEAELDDGISIVGSNDGSESDGQGGRRQGGAARFQERRPARVRMMGATRSSQKMQDGSNEPVRCMAPMFQPRTGVYLPYAAVGPQFEPPVRRIKASEPTGKDINKSQANSIVYGSALDDSDRADLLEAWTVTPFGPETALLHDLGWYKGKWSIESRDEHGEPLTGKVNVRWGGWYDDLLIRRAAPGKGKARQLEEK